MDLLVDIGNTNLKWAVLESGTLGEMSTVRHHGGLPIDLHAAWEQLAPPHRILVGNVGGNEVSGALVGACRSHWDLEPRFAATELEACGVRIAYEHPERLGVDRWLALIAAHRSCASPVLIVDAGTAITYDLLLGDGRHLGGLITPGIEMMRDGLLSGTHIPRVEPQELADPWAVDTGTAIAAGSIQAPAALAERLSEQLARQTGRVPDCILTGGDAQRLIPALRLSVQHKPDLVLRGLALLC
ncbi:MAG: type III pantothenate kinase [Chromatiaceae bacterium]|nr:type III pantothenate kinase [Chromatiaceae bacterium]